MAIATRNITSRKVSKATKAKVWKHCGQFVEWVVNVTITRTDGRPVDEQTAQAVAEKVMEEHDTLMNINWREGESGDVEHEGRKYKYHLTAERGDDHAVEDFTDWELTE